MLATYKLLKYFEKEIGGGVAVSVKLGFDGLEFRFAFPDDFHVLGEIKKHEMVKFFGDNEKIAQRIVGMVRMHRARNQSVQHSKPLGGQ